MDWGQHKKSFLGICYWEFIFFNDLEGQHNFLSLGLCHSWLSTTPAFLLAVSWYVPVPTVYQLSPPLDLAGGSDTHYCSILLNSSIITSLPISHLWNNSAFPCLSWWAQATEKYWRKSQTYSFPFPPSLRAAAAPPKLSNVCEQHHLLKLKSWGYSWPVSLPCSLYLTMT